MKCETRSQTYDCGRCGFCGLGPHEPVIEDVQAVELPDPFEEVLGG